MKGRRAAGRSGRAITIKQADARAAMATPDQAGIQSQGAFPPEAASGGLNLLVSTSLLERPETTQPARADNTVARQVSSPDDVAAPHKIEERQGLQQTLTGLIEYATPAAIKGWAWDSDNPTKRVHLELVEEGSRLATAVADVERVDLADIGIGDGRHGFVIELEPGLIPDGQPHVLDLRCSETGAAIRGSPITVQPSRTPFEWCLDTINDAELTGWLMIRNEPARHCVVVLKEGGRVLAQAMASLFRGDLLAAGAGDGCYGFSLQMPHSLLDGEEHLLEVIEMESGFALTEQPIRWRSTAGTGGVTLTGIDAQIRTVGSMPVARRSEVNTEQTRLAGYEARGLSQLPSDGLPASIGRSARQANGRASTHLLFDVSDLVYYIGEHANLTGIQRVQSSIVLSVIEGQLVPYSSAIFLSFNARTRNWVAIPTGFLVSLLRDLFLSDGQRLVSFPAEEARYGVLPGATEFDGTGVLDDGNPSVLCLLGAAWVHQDYLHRVLALKRRFGTRFVMTVHDLIPIYARETCDQDTARVFEEFMRRALRHVDHILAVSENTAKDVRRYLGELHLVEPPITVTKNGSSFAEFLPRSPLSSWGMSLDLPRRFVLFVATIEGRKNHRLMFEIWQRMIDASDDPPHLICVGRLGWKATEFVSALVETNYLDGRVHLLRDISDADLRLLYDRCLFTVCPTLYEGWGLPVGESLAMGKICVSSDRASVPEVAGDCGVYMNIDSVDESLRVVRDLIRDERAHKKIEAKIRRDYVPVTWKEVAERVMEACQKSVDAQWEEPYPYTMLPYSTEISFGKLDRDTDGTGELLLTRIVDARQGHFTHHVLEAKNFLLGEEIRSGGSWAQPERWGAWLCHSQGDVVFALAAAASHLYYVSLRLRVCGWLHERPIKILVNGEALWSGTIGPHSKDVMLRVRKSVGAATRWRMRIVAQVELTPELTSQIAAGDSRIPTIGFERLIVVPEDDLKTRLDVMSVLLLQ
jgi:glycosyltransferase involved in cell wall biosynthesis